MSQHSHPYDPHRALRLELTELISLRAWGVLSNESAARLEQLVTSSEQACRLYFDLLVETAALGRQAGMYRVAQQHPYDDLSGPVSEDGELDATLFQPGANELAELAAEHGSNQRRRRSYLTAKVFSLAAAVAVACWIAMAVWLFPRWSPDTNTVAISTNQPVGKFTGSANCIWSEDRRPALGDSLTAGPLKLKSGIAELLLSSGVRLVITGPAELELMDAALVRLDVGTLSVKVPKQAIGYTVSTRSARIVDLGTEFGVVADASGKTEVQVFEGNISLQPELSPTAASSPAMILSAGDSNCIEPDVATGEYAATRLTKPTSQIVRELPKAPAVTRPAYPDGLVAYWNFDEADGPVWDERGRNHGVLEGAKRVPGLIGKGAIEFSNQPGEQVRIPSRTSDLEFTDALTIEVLFTSKWSGEFHDYDEFLRKEDGNRLLLAFQHDNQPDYSNPKVPAGPVLAFGLTVDGVYQELDMPLDGNEGRPTLAELTDGKPHHVAATYSAMTGEKAIYVDGAKRFFVGYPAESKMASGGTQPLFIGSSSGGENFTGVLDELAIYRESLADHGIADHWKNVLLRLFYFDHDKSHNVLHD